MGELLLHIHEEKPLRGFPPGKIRIRQRPHEWVRAFVLCDREIREYVVEDAGDHWKPGPLIGVNACPSFEERHAGEFVRGYDRLSELTELSMFIDSLIEYRPDKSASDLVYDCGYVFLTPWERWKVAWRLLWSLVS